MRHERIYQNTRVRRHDFKYMPTLEEIIQKHPSIAHSADPYRFRLPLDFRHARGTYLTLVKGSQPGHKHEWIRTFKKSDYQAWVLAHTLSGHWLVSKWVARFARISDEVQMNHELAEYGVRNSWSCVREMRNLAKHNHHTIATQIQELREQYPDIYAQVLRGEQLHAQNQQILADRSVAENSIVSIDTDVIFSVPEEIDTPSGVSVDNSVTQDETSH